MSLLDTVLNNTVRILSEQHDTNRIATGPAGQGVRQQIEAIRRGDWDAAEYGISAVAQIAKLEAALTPEAMERELVELRQRAIRRADLDTSNGRVNVMVAGEAAWHKLGVNVESATIAATARELSGTNFRVVKMPYFRPAEDRDDAPDSLGYEASDRAYYLVRADTGAVLADYAGPDWQPIQNDTATDFLDTLIGEFGARYETAGSLYGGKKIWFQIHLPRQNFTLPGGDENLAYALFVNPHTPGECATLFPTNHRAVCANTVRTACAGDSAKGLRIRHTGDISAKLSDARNALGIAVEGLAKYAENARTLAVTRCESAERYFHGVLDEVLDVTEAQQMLGIDALAATLKLTEAGAAAKEREIKRRENLLDDILTRYEGAKNSVGGMRGTMWGAFNAVTEHADHSDLYRFRGSESDRNSRRMESALSGPADTMKQVAYAQALALAN